ncbi:putative 2-succinyl-6-hydroxy-2,4-cyclohexadiene-1-carboxylate synthase [Cyphellophora attinorum]|uniref:Putative 2-succinyl-6-hydroxy-2,4-cyclohexadiene-1-carboxylate synthase n=1 Tax=Cyphellophora attinorum TaxID=1664694 RepID=A0A0N1H1H8_9EURO|nr:putative 2-succinyl-6-hydroxy-2,4-cyclohexadiene-1-carboxylate synthase [Phialophora attinorum]KPI37970.1 putative 2-succinyl-6-hydroxy-2,4-cyclohexadiene-1-carboxylate synthase [Phialophora attinorum]
MPFLQHGPVNLYYEIHGSNTTNPPVILSHGFSSTSAMWQPQISTLSAHNRLMIWDMRGHGRTTCPLDQSLYNEAYTISDMHLLLTTLFPSDSKFIVGGLSLGGYMSLAFYNAYPDLVRALLIISTGPGFKSPKAREQWNQTAYAQADRFEKEGLKSLQNLSPERSSVTHEDTSGKSLALAARGMLSQHTPGVIEGLCGIKVPSLIVLGSEDKPFIGAGAYMEKKIRGTRKVVLKGAGHASNIDDVEGFNRAVVGFLQEQGLSGSGGGRPKL